MTNSFSANATQAGTKEGRRVFVLRCTDDPQKPLTHRPTPSSVYLGQDILFLSLLFFDSHICQPSNLRLRSAVHMHTCSNFAAQKDNNTVIDQKVLHPPPSLLLNDNTPRRHKSLFRNALEPCKGWSFSSGWLGEQQAVSLLHPQHHQAYCCTFDCQNGLMVIQTPHYFTSQDIFFQKKLPCA